MSNTHVCPASMAGGLDNRFRRWLQDPRMILQPHLKPGMHAIDIGCGPGFFTVDMAQLVGPTGCVTAVDLQQGMLERVQQKIRDSEFEPKITLHQCQEDKLDLDTNADFILLFYVVHEVPDRLRLLREVRGLLGPDGRVLLVEPKIHVSKATFSCITAEAVDAGFAVLDTPRIFFSRAVLLF